jgi:hypothetical protein
MKEFSTYLLIIFTGLMSWQCANRLSLEGGERDEEGPVLITDKSDENFQRNFKEREFELSFNEFVKIDKANEQIVISPLIRYNLTPTVRGKKIIFKFNEDEVLLPNTTYNIQFGEAIQDITEGNPINDLRYVFSTGRMIDSMQMRVKVLDLNDGKPVFGALVMLYETLSDTVIRKGRPTYFSKTDSSGLAVVQNCRPGDFRIFALVDENRNYQFDLAEEKIGHIDYFISSSLDEQQVYTIYLYNEIEPPYQQDVVKLDSQLYEVIIGGEIDYLYWSSEDGKPIESFIEKDTLFILTSPDILSIILSSDYSESDTIIIADITQRKNVKNRFRTIPPPKLKARYNSNDRITLDARWKNPVIDFDLQEIRVLNKQYEYILPSAIKLESMSDDDLKTTFSWNHKEVRDTLIFLPGAVSTWFAINDTILLPMRPLKTESLSNLIVKTTGLDSTQSYVAILRSSNGELVEKTQIKGVSNHTWEIPGIFPSNHELELITDHNDNGKRDGGWFDKRQLPEPSNITKIDNLRPDWDVQVEISPHRQNKAEPPGEIEIRD